MATKTFSGRVDERLLAFADELSRREHGLSFGQYCSTVLLEEIDRTGHMPQLSEGRADERKRKAAAFIKGFGTHALRPEIGKMSDAEIRDLIAGRYE